MNLAVRLKLKIEREAHALRFQGQPISLEHALRASSEGSLAVPEWRTISTGAKLRNPFLADRLGSEELGTWALDARTLNFLEQEIIRLRPETIFEFGTGLSTLCFARYLFEFWGESDKPRVFSVEQNKWQVEKSHEQLAAHGLENLVRILYAPLKTQTIEGLEIECYDLPDARLAEFLGGARPDMVLVDGPSGDGLVRFGTLPLLRAYAAPQAEFYLDDAFRPEELEVAAHWNTLPYLSVRGLRKVGKGLLTGQFASSRSAPGSPESI